MSDVVSTVFQKGVLFDITIGSWSAIHLMKPEDLLMDRLNKKAMHLGHKYLLAREDMYPVVNLEGKIRSYVAGRSAAFPIAGAVFVPYHGLKEMLKGLKELEVKYGKAADGLVKEYPQLMKKQLQVLDAEAERIADQSLSGYIPHTDPWKNRRRELDQWLVAQYARHRELYPKQEDLRNKFYVAWRMFKIDPVGSGQIDELGAEEIQAQQEKLKADMAKWVKDQTLKMHMALGQAAREANELLAKQEKLHPKNLKKIFDAFQTFKAIDFAGSDWQQEVDKTLAQYLVKDQLGDADWKAVADKVNSGEEFGELLAKLGQLAVEEVASAATQSALGKDFKRVIDL